MHSVFILSSPKSHQSPLNGYVSVSVYNLILKHPTMPGSQSLSICAGQLRDESQTKGLAWNVPVCRQRQTASNRPMQQLMHHPSSFIISICSSAHSVMSRLGQMEKCQVYWKIMAKSLFKLPRKNQKEFEIQNMYRWMTNSGGLGVRVRNKTKKHWLCCAVKAFPTLLWWRFSYKRACKSIPNSSDWSPLSYDKTFLSWWACSLPWRLCSLAQGLIELFDCWG